MSGAVAACVGHVLGLAEGDLAPDALRAAKTFLLDTLGVGIAGAAAPLTHSVRQAARSWGGEGGCSVWGAGALTAPPATAAFLNAYQIHCQEFDCVHEPAVVHPMAAITAALAAEVEAKAPISGAALLTALVGAVDVAVSLGLAARAPLTFFRPATAGVFGAALGVARLRGFSPAAATDAMGLALAFCAGTMQAHVEGTPALALQMANAARAALMACDLAEAGLWGARDSLEGPFGYFRLFEAAADPGVIPQTLARRRICEVSHKPFPTGRAAHGGLALLERLQAQGLLAGNLQRLTLRGPPLIQRLVGRPAVAEMQPSHARLCFPYLAARMLLSGRIGLGDFHPEALQAPEALQLAARVEVLEAWSGEPAAFTPQRLEAVLRDGRVLAEELQVLPGAPGAPLSAEANREKFRRCAAFGWGREDAERRQAVIGAVEGLEHARDAAAIFRLASDREGEAG